MSAVAAAFLAAALILGASTIACGIAFLGILAGALILGAAATLGRPRNPPQDDDGVEALIDATREPRTETRWSARAWAELDALTETAKDQNQ